MSEQEIIRLVQEVRKAQKRYFATRQHEWLVTAQNLERRLDCALEDYEGGQRKLFSEEE